MGGGAYACRIDRPEVQNALNPPVLRAIRAHLAEAAAAAISLIN